MSVVKQRVFFLFSDAVEKMRNRPRNGHHQALRARPGTQTVSVGMHAIRYTNTHAVVVRRPLTAVGRVLDITNAPQNPTNRLLSARNNHG